MTHTTEIKKLREAHGDTLARRNAFVLEMKKTYGIPTEEIARYFELDAKTITTRERYLEALTRSWWKLIWKNLTAKKK